MTITNPGYIPNVSALVSLATSDWANNVRDRLVQNFASVAQRDTYLTSPIPGQYAVTTDTMTTWQYQSATTGWTKPWSQAWGQQIQTANATAQSVASTTETVVTGMATTFTATTNRLYRVTCEYNVRPAAAAHITLRIKDGATLQTSRVWLVGTTDLCLNFPFDSGAWAGGSHTINLTCQSDNAAGWIVILPGTMTIDDVGPSAAPA